MEDTVLSLTWKLITKGLEKLLIRVTAVVFVTERIWNTPGTHLGHIWDALKTHPGLAWPRLGGSCLYIDLCPRQQASFWLFSLVS